MAHGGEPEGAARAGAGADVTRGDALDAAIAEHPRVHELARLSHRALLALDRSRATAFWAVSPIEVHGPHLPLGTDAWIAERVMRRAALGWAQRHADRVAVLLPPLCLGVDTLPLEGSLEVRGSVIEQAVVDCGESLARAGFGSLVIGNNHGGPRHMLALESARRRLDERTDLVAINAFGAFLKKLVARDAELRARIGIADDDTFVGSDADAHAGAFETGLCLAAFPEAVEPYAELPTTRVHAVSRVAAAMRAGARLLARGNGAFGGAGSRAAGGLDYAASLLDWINTKPMPSYLGAPSQADEAMGERALAAMSELTLELLEAGLAGESLDALCEPMLWDLRVLAKLPL